MALNEADPYTYFAMCLNQLIGVNPDHLRFFAQIAILNLLILLPVDVSKAIWWVANCVDWTGAVFCGALIPATFFAESLVRVLGQFR